MTRPDMTAGRVPLAGEIECAQRELATAGVGSARADAEWLAAWVLDVPRGRLITTDDIDADALVRYRDAVAQRAHRIPLQHIVGQASFGPVDLAVGPGVFIPRPETEMLLEWSVARLREAVGRTVVDLCSGSGALAIAIATMVPDARVTAVESSDEALPWLRRNVAEQPAAVAERITVVAADVTDATAMSAWFPTGSVDLVVSNPPYVPTASPVDEEVRHDPPSAVFGGANGMSVITPMVDAIATMLRPDGVVAIEHDDTTSAAVCSVLRQTGVLVAVHAHDDLTGRPRFATARHARMDR